MNNNSDISIYGYSSLASLTSLLLAEKGIKHQFFIEKIIENPMPIANPLTSRATQLIEENFISSEILQKIHYMEKYDFQWYDNMGKEYLRLNDYYKFPIYALDSRIRHRSFVDCLQKNDKIELIECENIQNNINTTDSSINIIGGGEKNAVFFENFKSTETDKFPVTRTLFLFNLKCNELLLKKYANVKMLCFSNAGEVVLYPFLHISGKNALNLVVNVIKGGIWDSVRELTNNKTTLKQLLLELSKTNRELAFDLANCELLDENYFSKVQISPYFKQPVKEENNKLFFGVGEAIYKIDPITGHGYNSGAEIVRNLVCLNENYETYVKRKMEELYQINFLFTQPSKNTYFNKVYSAAAHSESLRDFIISAFEDTSLFFPWLTDENESMKLVKMYQEYECKNR